MGNILEICPCGRNNNIYANNINNPPIIVNKDSTLERKDSTNSADQMYLNEITSEQLPQNVTEIKIQSKNLVQKRQDNPWDHYKDIKQLGEGSYGSVKKVKNIASGNIRAMKIIPKDIVEEGTDIESIKKEIGILSILDHPNIMKIFEFFEDDKNFYLVTEFCDQGDLGGLLGSDGTLPEFVVKYFMKQVFESISYLHSKHIIHGDIKRENLLLYSKNDTKEDFLAKAKSIDSEIAVEINKKSSSGIKRTFTKKTSRYLKDIGQYEVKLADFGCAKMFNKKKLKGVIGTTYYCSPEVLLDEYGEECDEWSCGILMYILLVGEPPFDGNSEDEVVDLIMNKNVDFRSNKLKNVSSQAKDLMKKLLIKDPKKRLTASDALKEPFFDSLVQAEKEMVENNTETLKKKFTLLHKTTIKGKTSKFKEMVIAYISLNFVTKAEEEKIKQIFKELSDDHSTYRITQKQFIKTIKNNLNEITEEDAMKMFQAIDDDHNGYIEYQELIRGLSDKEKLLNEENLKEAFDFFDEDKSQAISWAEINRIISIGKDSDNNDNKLIMNEFLKEIGKEENEEITFEEFKTIMLS